MKTHIKKTLVTTILLIGLFGYSNNNKMGNAPLIKEVKIIKPYLRLDEDKIYLTSLSLDKSPLKVEIYYESSDTSFDDKIFSETIENKINIQRIYRLDKTKKGTYTIILTTKGKSFIEYTTL